MNICKNILLTLRIRIFTNIFHYFREIKIIKKKKNYLVNKVI